MKRYIRNLRMSKAWKNYFLNIRNLFYQANGFAMALSLEGIESI